MAETDGPVNPPPAGAPPAAEPKPAAPPAAKPMAAAPPAAKPKPAAPPAPNPALAGRTTSAAARGTPRKAAAVPDDSSPLMGRRGWIGLAWGAFTASFVGCMLGGTARFMFPNVLNEPPQQFTIGFPTDYGDGVDERWKNAYGVWVVRTPFDDYHEAAGFYALLVTCTHLGCTPNWLAAESKFKCPCHGSGFRPTGINFEGPAPRPLERARIVLAEDGQIMIDKARKFQEELGQWTDPEAFLQV